MATTKTEDGDEILIIRKEPGLSADLEHSLESVGYKIIKVVSSIEEALHQDEADTDAQDIIALESAADLEYEESAGLADKAKNGSGPANKDVIDLRGEAQNHLTEQYDLTQQERIEKALRESEERYRNLFDNTPVGIYRTAPGGRILMANPAMVRMLGYTSFEEIASRDIRRQDIEATYDREEFSKRIEEEGEIRGREAQWVRRDGLLIFVRENVRAVCAQDGAALYYDGAVQDITNRRWAEMALQKSEEKYRKILEEIEDGYYEVDSAGNLTFFNRSLCKILGRSDLELIGLNYREFQTAESAQRVYEAFNKVYRTGEPIKEVAYEIVAKDGERRFVETSVALIRGSDGKPVGFRGILRDVTERRRSEEALRKSEESYRLLFERNLYGVFRSTTNGRIIDCNDAFVQIHGYDSKEDIKAAGAQNLYFHAEDRKAYLDLVKLKTPVLNLEVLHRRKDGSPVWALSNVNFIEGEDGEQIIEGVLLDISDRKKVETELKASRRRLRDLTRHQQMVREDERTRIAREIHDELGQALTGLKLDLAWMRSRLPESSANLSERLDSMTGLIDSTIHTMQRIATELRPRILDDLGLVAAIEWQAQEWQNRTGIRIDFKAEPEEISMNRDRSTALFRIFQESLTNVTRHANATEVGVSLIKSSGSVALQIEDNGRGITEEEIGHFKSLGLIGMRERALAWGGTVDIERAGQKGTKVTACLPLDQEVQE